MFSRKGTGYNKRINVTNTQQDCMIIEYTKYTYLKSLILA